MKNKLLLIIICLGISKSMVAQINVVYYESEMPSKIVFLKGESDSIVVEVPYENDIILSEKKQFVCILKAKNKFDSLAIYQIYDSFGNIVKSFNAPRLLHQTISDKGDLVLMGPYPSNNISVYSYLFVYNKLGNLVYKHPETFGKEIFGRYFNNGQNLLVYGDTLSHSLHPKVCKIILLDNSYHIFYSKIFDLNDTYLWFSLDSIDEINRSILFKGKEKSNENIKNIKISFNGDVSK